MPPAFVRSSDQLVVAFQRYGERPDEQSASDGADAVRVATAMIQARIALEPGDRLTVRKAETGLSGGLPEISRASHLGGE
jgi:hypothetical protein